jgi:hypothetical protein
VTKNEKIRMAAEMALRRLGELGEGSTMVARTLSGALTLPEDEPATPDRDAGWATCEECSRIVPMEEIAHVVCGECAEDEPAPTTGGAATMEHFLGADNVHRDPGASPGESAAPGRCSVCGSRRLALDSAGTLFGACSLVAGPDGKGGCPTRCATAMPRKRPS